MRIALTAGNRTTADLTTAILQKQTDRSLLGKLVFGIGKLRFYCRGMLRKNLVNPWYLASK